MKDAARWSAGGFTMTPCPSVTRVIRLLAVEDDPAMAAMIARGLRRAGYDVDIAADGADAVGKIVGTEYDVVVLDAMIPAPDGFEVCRRIRAERRWVPVLMLTA